MNYLRETITDLHRLKSPNFADLLMLSAYELNLKTQENLKNQAKSLQNQDSSLTCSQRGCKHSQNLIENTHKSSDLLHQKAFSLKSEYQPTFKFDPIYHASVLRLTNLKEESDYNFVEASLDAKEQQIASNIHMLRRFKKGSIFKIEEVKRKLKTYKKIKECECCGKLSGKHKCSHVKCNRKCEKILRYSHSRKQPVKPEQIYEEASQIKDAKPEEKAEESHNEVQKQFLEFIDEEVIKPEATDHQESREGEPTIKTLVIRTLEDVIPKIDKIVEEKESEYIEQQDKNPQEAQAIQKERISEVQSKSDLSDSKKKKKQIAQIECQQKAQINANPPEPSMQQILQEIKPQEDFLKCLQF